MPCCEIGNCAQMSKTIIAVWHFGLGGRESLKTAVNKECKYIYNNNINLHLCCYLLWNTSMCGIETMNKVSEAEKCKRASARETNILVEVIIWDITTR